MFISCSKSKCIAMHWVFIRCSRANTQLCARSSWGFHVTTNSYALGVHQVFISKWTAVQQVFTRSSNIKMLQVAGNCGFSNIIMQSYALGPLPVFKLKWTAVHQVFTRSSNIKYLLSPERVRFLPKWYCIAMYWMFNRFSNLNEQLFTRSSPGLQI